MSGQDTFKKPQKVLDVWEIKEMSWRAKQIYQPGFVIGFL